MRRQVVKGLVYSFFVGSAFTGCMRDAGMNQNERMAGGGDEGVSVERGEIAIDPTGTYLVSRTSSRLIYADLASGSTEHLRGLSHAARVTFDHEGKSLFLTRGLSRLPRQEDDDQREYASSIAAGEIVRYDIATEEKLWTLPVTIGVFWDDGVELTTRPWLDVTEDDRYLIATDEYRVRVIDAASGAIAQTIDVAEGVADVDVTPDQRQLVITGLHRWSGDEPVTRLQVWDLESFQQLEIEVPNCSAELVIGASGHNAFLAPSRCAKDPVSVIDLEQGKFVRNLPGFGPVALAKDGSLGVAFIDAENIEERLFDDPSQIPSDEGARYHLMLINTETLTFDVVELGDDIPRYAITPDGQLLLIDDPTLWSDGRIRILDVQQKRLATVLGASMRLDHYAMTRDSQKVFLLDDGLYTIDLATRASEAAQIDFTPTDLNLTPDDALLVLREDDETLRLYDAARMRELRTIVLRDDFEAQ